ncbi:hypothetical protein PPROV_000363700 [Pycnococcus provasolii]|uniref:Activator of Hsp90 ATPase AHSA1-like N-terminal domain-containing protein n=1 Tax=Pycnococcus provasolii TaxID=41880 RepID=A0A830HCU0_9CHLO|nr:hypothetical protein PPROV_000363700 [Pycnococcus provasolii]|mmetsp:Transcript_3457/g.9318  ORF Transcript_3457/g.9318 Transcript_3457/m.9318 type:complete len:337 (-) Transcript_3457:52-1062(-)
MAKLGEADERWIVEDRQDGTNVRGWHWSEKDLLPWSQDKLGELFENVSVDASAHGCESLTLRGVASCTGEAYLNTRKGKRIPGYELDVKVSYEAIVKGNKVTGKLHCPYLADENADDDAELKALPDGSGDDDEVARTATNKAGIPVAQKLFAQFVKDFADGGPFADGAVAPKKAPSSAPSADAAKSAASKPPPEPARKGRTVKMTEKFYCRPNDIYNTFFDEGRVQTFTQSRAELTREVGATCRMFDGQVEAVNEEIVENKLIRQRWRFVNWEDGCWSDLRIELSEPDGPGNTVMRLTQTGIPEEDRYGNNVVDVVEQGWNERYWKRMRQIMGFGA